MYQIIDSYGTKKIAWTWDGALSWLAACSPEAYIINRLNSKVIACRLV